MERAAETQPIELPGFADIACHRVRWPLSVLRLRGDDPERLAAAATRILAHWRGYSDGAAEILAETDAPHNTITPIARRRGTAYELDLTLRNNRTTEEHPLGLFHPHAQWHHIKKENIGLIEVMGLAVLPARLDAELDAVANGILTGADLRADALTEKHAGWAKGFRLQCEGMDLPAVRRFLESEVGRVFEHVLEDCGVFPDSPAGDAAFARYLESLTAFLR
jgi:UDPglucose--hexose-1-phosphate uridylyltransferase